MCNEFPLRHFNCSNYFKPETYNFSLKINKLPPFSEIEVWHYLKTVFYMSDAFTYRISTSHYVKPEIQTLPTLNMKACTTCNKITHV